MTILEATRLLTNSLQSIYEPREAANISDWVMEFITGWKKIDRLVHKELHLNQEQEKSLHAYQLQLMNHMPVQYVLGEAWFAGLKFKVNQHVLIPRPETEELVYWLLKDVNPSLRLTILDIGTGSGCIPITIKKNRPLSDVYSCDISEPALELARSNAALHDLSVSFVKADILHSGDHINLPMADIIISNPPYIPYSDQASMQANVLNHEPHLALFVDDHDPLVFYKAIIRFAANHLNRDGIIYLEIHEQMGDSLLSLLQDSGFEGSLKKDMQGRDRMVKAVR